MGFVATGDKHQAIAEIKAEMQTKMSTEQYVENGKIKSSVLPSFVDDIIEGYFNNNKFYKEASYLTEIDAESGKIYVDLPSNCQYRWSGSTYTNITTSIINDAQKSENTTYSSNKIDNLLSNKTEINDSEKSSSKTYSSNKIDNTFQTKTLVDAGNYFETDTVEGALQEIGSTLSGLESLLEEI